MARLERPDAAVNPAVGISLRSLQHVVVTNGGGATALEAVVSGHPVVMFDPIAGHGRANAALMTSAGLAWLAGSPAALTRTIRGLALVQPLLVCDLLVAVLIPVILRHRRVPVAGRHDGRDHRPGPPGSAGRAAGFQQAQPEK